MLFSTRPTAAVASRSILLLLWRFLGPFSATNRDVNRFLFLICLNSTTAGFYLIIIFFCAFQPRQIEYYQHDRHWHAINLFSLEFNSTIISIINKRIRIWRMISLLVPPPTAMICSPHQPEAIPTRTGGWFHHIPWAHRQLCTYVIGLYSSHGTQLAPI